MFVSNLPFDIGDRQLRALFSKFGKIVEINIPINPATNKPKGFAFVELDNKNHSLKAIHDLNGTQFKGRAISVKLAVD